MDIIQTLAECDLGHEVYHSDGFGHVQVETVSSYGFETPSVLLEKIEQDSLWDQFIAMAKTQPEEWLIDLVRYFPEDKPYSTKCFVEFLTIISDRNGLIILLQDSSRWYWDLQNISSMSKVFNIVEKLIDDTVSDGWDSEIDLIMLNQILEQLKERRSALECLP
jgi:hypothetical protein